MDYLPSTLKELYCSENQITSLDNLSDNLEILDCSNNQLTSLDNLPSNIKFLDCTYNQLKYNFESTLENIKKYNGSSE